MAILGPTATGKTEVAIEVARAINGEVVSADSMAVYRGMDVGTAKPTAAQREAVRFHLIDVAEPDEPFTVSRFKELALEALDGIRARGKRAIVAGGTGLYARVLLEDYGLTGTPADPAIRAELDAEAERMGAPALHARLAAVDPDAASRIHPNDRVRIVRALEVYLRTGEPISARQAQDAARRAPMRSLRFALTAPREELARRIDARVDAMIAAGLVSEARALLDRGYGAELPPLRSLGYKEIAAYLAGESDLQAAVEEIKRATRRFAKRQSTWFRAEPGLQWIDIAGKTPRETAAQIVAVVQQPNAA